MSQFESKTKQTKLWGGRFSEFLDAFVETFTASISFDQRLALQDIQGSLAHAKMLEKVGILTRTDSQVIQKGLHTIREDIQANRFEVSIAHEDIHMNIEARLIELVGEVGKKLHTARSRNDQVATDLRLYLRTEIDTLLQGITDLQQGLLNLAEREFDTIMPGFTHLQVAQPVTLGHHMLAWFEMLERDYQRFVECRKRVNHLPLGSAALAGTTFPIDRAYCAELLAFDTLCENSLDAVSDRDFVIEFCSHASIMMMHFSRIAEELILWASTQFQFIELPDRFCTGSSIMPQKKNPDVPELIRGKTGRVIGHLVSLLVLMKSQTLAYNKDNQEDKEPLFDTIDTLKHCLKAYAEMIPAVQVNKVAMLEAASHGFSTATDLADYLVNQGLAFRDAHEVVGQVVQLCIKEKCTLDQVPLDQLQKFNACIKADVYEVLTVEGSVNARNHIGGCAPKQVKKQVNRLRACLKERTGASAQQPLL